MQILREMFGDYMAEKWRDIAYKRGHDNVNFTKRITNQRIEFAGR